MSGEAAVLWGAGIGGVIGFAGTSLTIFYQGRNDKRRNIRLAALKLIAAARQLRRNYIGFVEYNSDFVVQQVNAKHALRKDDDRSFSVHKDAANFSQSIATGYQKDILGSQKELDEAYFALMGYDKSVENNEGLGNAISQLLGYKLGSVVSSDASAEKDDINEKFEKPLKVVQFECSKLIKSNS